MPPKKIYFLMLTIILLGFFFYIIAEQPVSKDKDDFTNKTVNEMHNQASPASIPAGSSTIFIKGSDTILPVSTAESKAYMDLHPETKIVVIGGGSSIGLASFIEGEVEIAMASRKIKESEISSAASRGIEPVETVIGWDGISVIVNKKNPVEKLSIEQLQSIYSGKFTNWKELGGNDETIRVLIRDPSSGTYSFFKDHVLLNMEYTKTAITEPNTEAVVKDVSANTAAIGYIGLAYADDSIKTLGLGTSEGTFYPEAALIRKGTYPLSRPLYYYTDGKPEGEIKGYIDFVLSEQGQEILSEIGYLPVS